MPTPKTQNFAVTPFAAYGLSSYRDRTWTREEAEIIAERKSLESGTSLPVAVEAFSSAAPAEGDDADDPPGDWVIVGLWLKGRRFAPVEA